VFVTADKPASLVISTLNEEIIKFESYPQRSRKNSLHAHSLITRLIHRSQSVVLLISSQRNQTEPGHSNIKSFSAVEEKREEKPYLEVT